MKRTIDKKQWALHALLFGFIAALVGFACVILSVTQTMVQKSSIRLACFVFAGMLALVVLLLFWLTRRQYVRFSDKLSDSIEELVKGKNLDFFDENRETLTAKIQHQLLRLDAITSAGIRQSAEQKQAVQQTISDISHQLKTPISNISLYNATLLNRDVPEEQQQEFLLAMQNQVEKLDFLIQTLIKMSRLEQNMIVLHKQMQPLYETIASALSGILLSAEKKRLSISVDCEETLTLPHDVKWTTEALFNLFDNAVKYTDEQGEIQIRVQVLEMYVRIDVADTGMGIAKEHVNDIFKRFYREPKVHQIQGVGVGLYLTREIVTRQQGYLKVSARAEKGTVFSVYLPNRAV